MLGKSFNSKRVFKEKIVQLYISIIKKEESGESNQNFWNEFFLLKANGNALELELKKLESHSERKAVLNLLFSKCLVALRDANQLRVLNGLITLSALSNYVLHFMKLRGEEQIDVLIGNEHFSGTFEEFVDSICDLLFSYHVHGGIKDVVLKLLLIFASADLDVNRNAFMDQLMSDQLFDALIHLLNSRVADGCRTLLLLVVFLNYKKRSINNPYVMKLSLSDEVILSEYSQVIFNELVDFNARFERICADSRGGLFSALSSMVGIIFPGDDSSVDIPAVIGRKTSLQGIKTVLLAFYEAALLNRNFILLLTTSLPDAFISSVASTLATSATTTAATTTANAAAAAAAATTTSSPPPNTDQILDAYADLTGAVHQPANLLVAFLEFTSIIMLDKKDESTLQLTRLCFIILTVITEDACASSAIHDVNLSFIVDLHLMPMRHRKVSSGRAKGSRPLAHTILDLMIEFILSHLSRPLQTDLFALCLGVLQRLLSFQRRCRLRLHYHWQDLWAALTALLKYLASQEGHLLKHGVDLFSLAGAVLGLLNLFITAGDAFLASTATYDQLYYEIIRNYDVFDKLNSLALRQLTKKTTENGGGGGGGGGSVSSLKDSATRLTSALINVKAIAAHFSAKIEAYSSANQIVTLSEAQVLEVIGAHYDSLTLKMVLADGVDLYEPYDPARPAEVDCQAKLLASILQQGSTLQQQQSPHLLLGGEGNKSRLPPQSSASYSSSTSSASSNLLLANLTVGFDEQQALVAQLTQTVSSLVSSSSSSRDSPTNSLEVGGTAAVAASAAAELP